MAMTLAQKILQMHTDEEVREVGQIVECSLSGVLANDITGPLAIKSFRAMGAKKVFDKDKVFLVMDHYTPQKDIESANQVIVSRNFAKEMGITHYYEGGCAGVEHALLPEKGLVDTALHCHYKIEEFENRIDFHLYRTCEDLRQLLKDAKSHGVTTAVGLYQELGRTLEDP